LKATWQRLEIAVEHFAKAHCRQKATRKCTYKPLRSPSMRRWMGALRRFEPRYHRTIQNHQYFSTAISFEIIELFPFLKCKKLFFYILKA